MKQDVSSKGGCETKVSILLPLSVVLVHHLYFTLQFRKLSHNISSPNSHLLVQPFGLQLSSRGNGILQHCHVAFRSSS
jgi:hypothetical protein